MHMRGCTRAHTHGVHVQLRLERLAVVGDDLVVGVARRAHVEVLRAPRGAPAQRGDGRLHAAEEGLKVAQQAVEGRLPPVARTAQRLEWCTVH